MRQINKPQKVIIALALAFIMAISPAIPFMQPTTLLAQEYQLGNVNAEPFELRLTAEARDLVLYDFDYLISIILENTPWKSVINRRLDMDFMEYVQELRDFLLNLDSLLFPLSLEEYEELLGMPLYEFWFPIHDSTDPRYIAATFIGYFLWMASSPFEGIGHMFPRALPMYTLQYSMMRINYHDGYIDRETDPDFALRYDTFTHPTVRWFYGEIDVDLYAEALSVFPEVDDNIVTQIISPGEIAYLQIDSFATSAAFDDLIIAPFFEEIRDFDHLIIDIRGNGGGFMFNFTHNIMGRLIHEPVEVTSHEFFTGGPLATRAMNAVVESTAYRFSNVDNNAINQWYTIEVLPARDFIVDRRMFAFNHADLLRLDYVMVERNWVFPTGDNLTFDGKVWLLIDGGSASASSEATLMLMETGLATVVGENTSGVMAAQHFYQILPNTGLLYRIDVGYRTDADGRSLEAYGIAPDVRNFYGMDALQTVLELIRDPYATDPAAAMADVSDNDIADDPGEDTLDEADSTIAPADEPEYDPFESIPWGAASFTSHPLLGTWAWDYDDSFIYELRPDGTGVRGFYFHRNDIYWYVYNNNLFIKSNNLIEHWTFTIVDGVLTITSAQIDGITWSYLRQ